MNAHPQTLISEARPTRQAVKTTCPYCGVGCGVIATPDGKGGLDIAGDPDHPANFGRLCSKGSALGETVGLATRLLHPMLRTRSGAYERATWADALDRVADGLQRIRRDHGADALAFYLSGQLLTEDYYVANKLMKGFLGSGHVDTNSRLCMASSVAGHRRAFGSDTVPGSYEDLDQADLIVLVGSNAAWCHPVLFQRMQKNRIERGARLIVIDPRRTATAEGADMLLAIRPGADAILWQGLLVHLAQHDALDRAFINAHTQGFDAALSAAQAAAPDVATVAAITGLAAVDVEAFFTAWRTTPQVVSAWSQGINQSAQGTDKVDAIINCHLSTGRIGKPGLGPLSLTGQPNAMGGREVGGLANMLAAHMGYTPAEIDRVRRFWAAPAMAQSEGLKAVQMMEAVAEGRIRALWVMGTNPAVSLPRADHVRTALGRLDLFVVSENVLSNDTLNAGAHVLLPAAAWAEKDGTVTNSERRISRQRGLMPLPGDVQPDWWIMGEVARRLGFGDAFAWEGPAGIFREHAALSAFENGGARDFDIGALAGLDAAAYDALEPVQWPVRAGAASGTARMFADGRFFHADGKARFVAPAGFKAAADPDEAFPFILNTGRLRDQWHTMTRTGLSPRLGSHRQVPFVEVAPTDAERLGLKDGGFARVTSPHGEAILAVRVDKGISPGQLFVPIHWTAETASHGRIGALVQAATDPFSGQPEMKATPASIAPQDFAVAGFALARHRLTPPPGWWWARVALDGGEGLLLAANGEPDALAEAARDMLRPSGEGLAVEYVDALSGGYRAARLEDGALAASIFLGRPGALPAWDAVAALLRRAALSDAERRVLLAGRALDGLPDPGPVICACFGVGLTAIAGAIRSGEATSVEAIGRHLKAGTNCGSCVPELRAILARTLASREATDGAVPASA
jgi:assimilatory nitrate reductase catalytic subunit